jgi:hypothetical protein
MQLIDQEHLINRADLLKMAEQRFGNLVKAVVDIEKQVMMIDAELHADQEAALLEQGSRQEHLWGINLYPELTSDEWLEFDSMINLRPSQQNRSRSVEDPLIQAKIRAIVERLVPS